METPERLLSDEEIGRVIKRASELDARSDGVSSSGTVSPAGSLSIQTVREIAEEIGIAAELADQAAAEVLVRPSDGLARLAGGPFRERMHAAYPRQLSQDQVRALVDRLRGTVQQQGTVKDVLGAVEWSVGGIVVDQLHPDLLGMLGLLGSGVAVGAGVARGLWSVTARGFRRRLRAVQSEIHQFMRTGESEESLPSGDGSSEDHRFEPGGSDG